jgi:hypothetical protein
VKEHAHAEPQPSDIIAGAMRARTDGAAARRWTMLQILVALGIAGGLGVWVFTGSEIGVMVSASSVGVAIWIGDLKAGWMSSGERR